MSEQVVMRILRESKGFSQEYVAGKLSINQNTYSKLENGQIKLTVERMKKIADLYGVPADLFLSNSMPVVNYNTGEYSRSIIFPATYKETEGGQNQLYERIIEEKDKQIDFLSKELQSVKFEKEELKAILKNSKTKA